MIQAGILGATGYAGFQLVNLLKNHPQVHLKALASKSYVDQPYSDVFPAQYKLNDQLCDSSDIEALSKTCDVLFLALPHGHASADVTEAVLNRCKIIDLGADFRLHDADTYTQWYGVAHQGRALLSQSVYGLCELYRDAIKSTSLVANPGCYTTAAILSLYPLVKEGLIDTKTIIIDAKSGVSGAGRGLSLGTHFCECNESIKAYGVGTHRHTPEIEQELSQAAGYPVTLSFTPHLVPMNRGILATSYAQLKANVNRSMIQEALEQYYGKEYFIRLRKGNSLPETNQVKGSNFFDLNFHLDERTDRIVLIGALDNLMKGAASQAVQNMNLLFGFQESTAIDMCPMMM